MPRSSALPGARRKPPKSWARASLVTTRGLPPPPPVRSITLIERGSHAGLPQRRSTDKTRHLDFNAVANLVNAVAFANHKGSRLTVAITLLWSHVAGFRENRLPELTTQFLQGLARWLRRHANVELHGVWTRERGYQKGHHINIMANIPVSRIPQLKDYLMNSFNITANGLDFKYGDFGMKTTAMQMGKLRYFCKSLDHTAFLYRGFETYNIAELLGIRHTGTDGVVRAKRAGTTENLGRTARRQAGWRDARFPEEVADLLNPAPSRRTAA